MIEWIQKTWQSFAESFVKKMCIRDRYQVEPTEHHEIRITAKFICDRGVSHEFVRHRVFRGAELGKDPELDLTVNALRKRVGFNVKLTSSPATDPKLCLLYTSEYFGAITDS